MDLCDILLFFVIIVAIIVVVYFYPTIPIIIGGASISNRLFIPDNEKLVVDGHNMIHDIVGNKYINNDDFKKTLRQISETLSTTFPTNDLHIVIKNNDINTIEISEEFPSITYHVAYLKNERATQHHEKARDDFLTIMLAKDGYMISKDRFRDFNKFGSIKSFKHYTIKNGFRSVETVKPLVEYRRLDKPSIGNHFLYQFETGEKLRSMGIKSGNIYKENDSVFAKVYLEKYND